MKRDPFAGPTYDTPRGPIETRYLTVDDRMRIVRQADAETLRAILALSDFSVQATVRLAAKRRLRKLEAQP